MAMQLAYWVNVRRLASPVPRAVLIAVALVSLGALYGVIRGDFRTSAEVRLDSGDLRYCYFGIPIEYRRMPEPQRPILMTLSSQPAAIRPEWRRCMAFPQRGTNHRDSMCRQWYHNVADWAPTDPIIARMLLEDVALAVKDGDSYVTPLFCHPILTWDGSGHRVVEPGWQDDPEVRFYLASKRKGGGQ